MNKPSITLPLPAVFILHQLKAAGFDAYIVGGAVRDLILRADPDSNFLSEKISNLLFDFDFTTNAKPEEILEIFVDGFYDNNFGTVAIAHKKLVEQLNIEPPELFKDDQERLINLAQATKIHSSLKTEIKPKHDQKNNYPNFEITTYRSKELYDLDNRKPSSFSWGKTLDEDLQRRDFTINALAISVDQNFLINKTNSKDWYIHIQPEEYQLYDNFDGIKHLEQKQITAVGNAQVRFKEDALRILRAIRFSVQLNFKIEDKTFQAIIDNSPLLRSISWERIRDEFLKILASDYPAEGIELLYNTGILSYILPELVAAKGIEQSGHHTTDVWTHSLDALRTCPSDDVIVRLATLLHDIGKPTTQRKINNQFTFYNHEVVGARTAKRIAQRFKLSKKEIDRVFLLVRHHMFYYQPQNTDSSIRRFMKKVGLENLDDIIDLREADRLGSGAKRTSWRLEELKQRMVEQLHQPMDTTDLKINGHDLMSKLDLKPGPILGVILNQLLEHVLEFPEDNNTKKLLELANKIRQSS